MADQKQKKFTPANNPAEILKDSVREISSVPKMVMDEALTQIGLKERKTPMSGEIDLVNHKERKIDGKIQMLQNVQRQEKELFNAKQKAVESQVGKLIQELHAEVGRLEKQTAELSSEVRNAAVETIPANPGLYHLNFFDWIINTLKDLRKRVNDSRLWLNMWTQKKKQKGYWAMTKKHGQKFQMSDERSVATAAG